MMGPSWTITSRFFGREDPFGAASEGKDLAEVVPKCIFGVVSLGPTVTWVRWLIKAKTVCGKKIQVVPA